MFSHSVLLAWTFNFVQIILFFFCKTCFCGCDIHVLLPSSESLLYPCFLSVLRVSIFLVSRLCTEANGLGFPFLQNPERQRSTVGLMEVPTANLPLVDICNGCWTTASKHALGQGAPHTRRKESYGKSGLLQDSKGLEGYCLFWPGHFLSPKAFKKAFSQPGFWEVCQDLLASPWCLSAGMYTFLAPWCKELWQGDGREAKDRMLLPPPCLIEFDSQSLLDKSLQCPWQGFSEAVFHWAEGKRLTQGHPADLRPKITLMVSQFLAWRLNH